MSYFVFNKNSDYVRGYLEHLQVSPKGIATEASFFGKAAFFSRMLDSAKEGTIWHRMTGKIKENSYAAIRISFYTSDRIVFEGVEGTFDLHKLICSEEFSISEKKKRLTPFLKKELSYEQDILLHDLEGRYLWFLLEIYPQTDEVVELGEFMVSFGAKSWMTYLPELYQKGTGNNSFLDRYLSIFQSLYDDMGKKIRNVVEDLDPKTADKKALEWLAKWLDIETPYIWNEQQLRFLIAHSIEFQEARGTKRGIELFVELYTGEKPFVIEWQDFADYHEQKEYGKLLGKLYTDDPESFTVLVKESCIPTHKEQQTLLRILEQIKPVQMEVNLIVLEEYLFLDGYSYLGVNSVLGQYEEAVLGENSRLAFATLAEDCER